MVRTRREFIARTTLVTATLGTGRELFASAEKVRSVELLALHTNEYLKAPYRADGELLEKNLSAINHLLRDHRTDEVYPIDPELLDYLHGKDATRYQNLIKRLGLRR